MWFFFILTWISLLVQVCFVTVSLAAGLYYLAELVEEYTVIAKNCISWMIMITATVYVGLWLIEDLPLSLFICGFLSQLCHWFILKTFPFVNFASLPFIVGLVMVVVNHYLAFSFFADATHSFSEVLAYFILCLWLVPFALFISLSANENVLPTTAETRHLDENDVVTNYFSKRGKKYGLLSFFNYAKESILPQRNKKAF